MIKAGASYVVQVSNLRVLVDYHLGSWSLVFCIMVVNRMSIVLFADLWQPLTDSMSLYTQLVHF